MEREKEPKINLNPEQKGGEKQEQQQEQEKEEPRMEKVEGIEILAGEGKSAKLKTGKLQIELPIKYERYNEMADGVKIVSRKIGEHFPEGLAKPPVSENGIYRQGKYLVQIVEANERGLEGSLVRVVELPENIEYID